MRTDPTVLRLIPSFTSRGRRGDGVRPEQPIELAEAVGAAVDVDDVHVVEQAVEDGGGEDFVAGEDLGPVAHVLVGGQDDGCARRGR